MLFLDSTTTFVSPCSAMQGNISAGSLSRLWTWYPSLGRQQLSLRTFTGEPFQTRYVHSDPSLLSLAIARKPDRLLSVAGYAPLDRCSPSTSSSWHKDKTLGRNKTNFRSKQSKLQVDTKTKTSSSHKYVQKLQVDTNTKTSSTIYCNSDWTLYFVPTYTFDIIYITFNELCYEIYLSCSLFSIAILLMETSLKDWKLNTLSISSWKTGRSNV